MLNTWNTGGWADERHTCRNCLALPREADSSWGAGCPQAFANFICPAHQLLIYTLAFLGLDILLILWCPTFKFYGG